MYSWINFLSVRAAVKPRDDVAQNHTILKWKYLTCTLMEARPLFHSMAAEFAAEVVFPELSKPDIPSVVFQRSADEVAIKPWTDQWACCQWHSGCEQSCPSTIYEWVLLSVWPDCWLDAAQFLFLPWRQHLNRHCINHLKWFKFCTWVY